MYPTDHVDSGGGDDNRHFVNRHIEAHDHVPPSPQKPTATESFIDPVTETEARMYPGIIPGPGPHDVL